MKEDDDDDDDSDDDDVSSCKTGTHKILHSLTRPRCYERGSEGDTHSQRGEFPLWLPQLK